MWGYDQAHAPPRTAAAGDCPDLVSSEEAVTPQWMGITSDQSFFRKVTGLVFALAVLACFAAIMLSARGRLRPTEVVDGRTSAEPKQSPMLNSPPVHFRGLANVLDGGNAGIQAQTSVVGAGSLLPGGKNSPVPGEKNFAVVNAGSAVTNAVSARLVNPAYVAGETGRHRAHAVNRHASLQRRVTDTTEKHLENGKPNDVTLHWPFRAL